MLYIEEDESVNKTQSENIELQSIAAPAEEIPEDPKNRIIDWTYLHNINKDIVAWIYVPNTNIDYPVIKGEGDYYLHRNIYGKYDINGSIFTNEDIYDRHIVIFGHNMKQEVMFGRLQESEINVAYLYTPDQTFLYEKQKSYVCSPTSSAFLRDFQSDEQYQEWLINEGLHTEGQTLTLVACADNNRTKRYVVHLCSN